MHGTKNTEVTVKIRASESELRINVSDNGGGMSNVEAERLFERYYRGTDTESNQGDRLRTCNRKENCRTSWWCNFFLMSIYLRVFDKNVYF